MLILDLLKIFSNHLTLNTLNFILKAEEVKKMYPKRKGEFVKIFDALMSLGALLEVKDRTGKTPLFYTFLAASEQGLMLAC